MSSQILALSPELHDVIWECTFNGSEVIFNSCEVIFEDYNEQLRKPDLLSVCKQVRFEALPIYYQQTVFYLPWMRENANIWERFLLRFRADLVKEIRLDGSFICNQDKITGLRRNNSAFDIVGLSNFVFKVKYEPCKTASPHGKMAWITEKEWKEEYNVDCGERDKRDCMLCGAWEERFGVEHPYFSTA